MPSNLYTAGLKVDKTATFMPPLLLGDLLLLLPGTIAISKPSTTPVATAWQHNKPRKRRALKLCCMSNKGCSS